MAIHSSRKFYERRGALFSAVVKEVFNWLEHTVTYICCADLKGLRFFQIIKKHRMPRTYEAYDAYEVLRRTL